MSPDRIAVLLLAAGRSARFGSKDKMMALWHGRPLFAHMADRIATLPFAHRIAVTRGASEAPVLHDRLAQLGFAVTINSAPERGLSTSLALGVAAARMVDCDAILICLADMPEVPEAHLIDLCTAAADMHAIIASTNGVRPSPPALFGRVHFDSLGAITGDRGAHHLLSGATWIKAPAGALRDVDWPEDLVGC